jgi:hypothetical protein
VPSALWSAGIHYRFGFAAERLFALLLRIDSLHVDNAILDDDNAAMS